MALLNPHQFRTPDFIKKHGPVLTCNDIPYESVQIFNAGITKYNGKYVMIFRNDYACSRETIYEKSADTNLGLAFSDDGIKWEVEPQPCWDAAWLNDSEAYRIYDPRLTVIDGKCYVCFAMDTWHGVRGGIAVTEDFDKFEILNIAVPENRNMVLFPEKIKGLYMRLERPMPVYGRSAKFKESFDIWSSKSPDLKYWGEGTLVLPAEKMPCCNSKIGPGAPPVKTKYGWLTLTHFVNKVDYELPSWGGAWNKMYYGGVMLLDLEDPNKVIGIGQAPLMVPETEYEMDGFRGGTIFPGGMILEDSGEVKIYYGAADTYECLATCDVNDLLNFVMQK
jgi:beta-1,4-mannooligosaccharide/beta-1,4-mannosyl-N-acetylglucosamine phosphorylase